MHRSATMNNENMGDATSINVRLQQLRRQYFALYPIRLISFGSENTDGTESLCRHQEWIWQRILSASYQPANDYQRKFLKALICAIEEDLRSVEATEEEWVSTASPMY